jgi:hypothetical protein
LRLLALFGCAIFHELTYLSKEIFHIYFNLFLNFQDFLLLKSLEFQRDNIYILANPWNNQVLSNLNSQSRTPFASFDVIFCKLFSKMILHYKNYYNLLIPDSGLFKLLLATVIHFCKALTYHSHLLSSNTLLFALRFCPVLRFNLFVFFYLSTLPSSFQRFSYLPCSNNYTGRTTLLNILYLRRSRLLPRSTSFLLMRTLYWDFTVNFTA